MTENRFNFTKAKLERISPPERAEASSGGKYETYYDTGEKGLVLLVSNGGAKTFYLYMRINGQPKRVKLGAFPSLSIENARKEARTNKGLVAQGKDPHAEKQRKRTEGSLSKFFHEQYLELHARKHNRTWEQDRSNFERLLSPLHNKSLSDITRNDIQAIHSAIGKKNGEYIANRILALLHSIFNKAVEWGWQGTNPVYGVKKFKERSRERFLQPEELPRFFEALEAEPNRDMCDYFMMLLLTGARRRNVGAMRWKDISLELACWTIPETKNGESYTVNLPQDAVNLLKNREHTKETGWVFPSATSKSGHLEEPKSAWKRLLKRAGIEDLRIHDLRRTLGSYQAISGASGFIIGKSLGHKSSAATEIYARLNSDPVRESVEKALSSMFGVAGVTLPKETRMKAGR